MPSLTNYAESGILNFLLRSNTNTFAAPTNISLALCRDVPSRSVANGAELPELTFANGYGRANLGAPSNSVWTEVSQTAESSGTLDNLTTISFGPATADWGYVSGVAICTSYGVGSGNVLMVGAISTPRDVKSGDTFQYGIGNFDILLS